MIYFIYTVPQPTQRETMLLNVLLFILSSVAAVIIGYYFAKLTNSEKVDTIAERSTEKMVHLSLQLHSLKEFLEDTEDIADEEQAINIYAGMNAYRHRTVAAAYVASSLASSNETFRGDWLGVVTATTKKRIEQRYDALRTFMQDYETIQKLQAQKSVGAFDDDEELVTARLKQAEQRMESIQQSLPIQPPVFRRQANPPAVEVSQTPTLAEVDHHKGTIMIKLLRPVFNATGSGKFSPPMSGTPYLQADLVTAPNELQRESFRFSPGTGTGFDFNIGLKSTAYGVHLPMGDYVFSYDAKFGGTAPQPNAPDATGPIDPPNPNAA
jgi:hypothetical protein